MTPHNEIPPPHEWQSIAAAGYRLGFLSLKEKDPKKVKRAEQNRAQYERRKGKEGV